jgi:hypothetical protein
MKDEYIEGIAKRWPGKDEEIDKLDTSKNVRTIQRYEIEPGSTQMPMGAQILHVGEQQDGNRLKLYVWAKVNVLHVKCRRDIQVVYTDHEGHRALRDEFVHIGTVQSQSGKVFHIFDGGDQ